ncbi:MAG: GMC family oxidoreductase N-terminal domain-containing protein [Candidatus Limnocylindria bacterium]
MPTPWTERELATLAAIAETFVRGDALRRARLVTEALERAADPSQIAQLRLVLRALESRAANLVLGAGPSTFATLSPADRERVLLAWGTSRIGQRRAAFAGLRRLMTFLAYADPGVGAPNPRHAAIGYQLQRPPVTASRTPIVPMALPFDTEPRDAPLTLEADVVVVGSGAGGGVMASALAEAGRSVVVLEAGPFVDEASMPTDELDAFARLYLNHGLLATWDGAVTMLAGSGVGGGTLVNWMTTIDAPAPVRTEWAREHGIDDVEEGSAWSADVEVLERELAVTPTSAVPPKDQLILQGAEALGWEAAPIRRDSPGCDDCGSCGFGCPRGTKRSGIRTHLVSAWRAGASIVPRVRVTSVVTEGGRAVGVEGLALVPDPATGAPMPDEGAPGGVRVRRLVVRAPQVVLAAGALRTPAILQASGIEHPAIGRNLRIHPVSGVVVRAGTPIEMWRGPMQGARSLQFVDAEPGRRGYVIESAPGHPGLIALALPWEGTDAHARLMGDLRYLAPLLAVTRDGGQGRVSLTRAGRVRVDYALDRSGVATLRHALASMARMARAVGAVEMVVPGVTPAWFRGGHGRGGGDAAFERYLASLAAFDFAPNRATVFSAHQMGSVRMGADPGRHACDPAGRVRAGRRDDRVIGGLYVADTSLFPTALGVNPMLSAMALARRVARTVLAEG